MMIHTIHETPNLKTTGLFTNVETGEKGKELHAQGHKFCSLDRARAGPECPNFQASALLTGLFHGSSRVLSLSFALSKEKFKKDFQLEKKGEIDS